MILLMRKQTCAHAMLIHDSRHLFVVTLVVHGKCCRIYVLHMPRRTRGEQYRQVLHTIAQLRAMEPPAFEIYLGDWNKHVPSHVLSMIALSPAGVTLVCTGAEKRPHKDWAAVTAARTTVARVACEEGLVAIPPLVVLALSFSVTAWGGSSASYRPVSIGAWDQGDRRAFGDMLEALSQYDGGTGDWLARYRDAMEAVEQHRRQGQEAADMARAHARMQQAERHPQQPPSHDQATWDKTKRDRASYAMVKERNVLMHASLTTEASTILRLTRTVPF